MERNNISKTGAKYFLKNITLTELNLTDNNLGKETAENMSNARTKYNNKLKDLLFCKINCEPQLLKINDLNNIIYQYTQLQPIKIDNLISL